MKLWTNLCLTIIAMTFFTAVATTATQPKDNRKVVFNSDATVAGSHLASGSYNVQWQTHSPQATVTFLRKSKVIATAEGIVVDRGTKYPSDAIVSTESADGTREIQEIRFRDSSEVLVFDEPKDPRNVVLHSDAMVAGSHLPSGVYNVEWQTHSPEATVKFLRQSSVVATAEGKVVDRGRKYPFNEIVFNANPDGTREIQEIRFQESSEVLVFKE